MKKLLLAAFVAFTSLASLADEVKGLYCSTTFIVHEKNKKFNIDRVSTSNSLLGAMAALNGRMLIPIENHVRSFGESYTSSENSLGIDFDLDVGAQTSSLGVSVYRNNQKIDLGTIEFKTKEGISRNQHLSDFIKFESRRGKDFRHFTDVIVTCLPAY
jgi:hypothetical protein